MPKKPSQNSPQIVQKTFTATDITQGLEKLKRRIAEVEGLDTQQIAHDDARVETAQHNIRDTVREVFGAQSQEAVDYTYPRIYASSGRRVGFGERVNHQGNFSKGIVQMVTSLNGLIARLEEKRLDIQTAGETEARNDAVVTVPESTPPHPAKVFVVVGRNEKARKAMFAFLRSIDLDPKEWTQWVRATGQGSPYTGEVLKKGFREAKAFVILMTPDDEARLREPLRNAAEEPHEINLTPQPRPNVIFEAGMAMMFAEERTILVELGRLRPISDIFGRHVVRMNNTPESRKELAQRLETAGCRVDLTGNDWLDTGDFEAALEGL